MRGNGSDRTVRPGRLRSGLNQAPNPRFKVPIGVAMQTAGARQWRCLGGAEAGSARDGRDVSNDSGFRLYFGVVEKLLMKVWPAAPEA